MHEELPNKEIRKRILTAIVHTAPDQLHLVGSKVERYIEILSQRIMDCCDEKGEVFRCESCMEAGVILRTTRAAIERYSK
jgi:hypothetical protein